MEKHNIHGQNINFHHGSDDSKHFLRDSMHSSAFKEYLETAKEKGKTYFVDPSGKKYAIEHKNEENEDIFSIRRSRS